MKTNVLDIHGKKAEEITLPKFFSEIVREDIVAKVLETRKTKQPYAPSPTAGKHHSASGNIQHRRHVWKTMQGKGISRIPRKIMSRRGERFNWIGAEIPNTRGGRRAHPPKLAEMMKEKKINKKELSQAFKSALSATANEKFLAKKYASLKNEKFPSLPFVAESKLATLNTKDFISSLKKIVGEKLFEVSLSKKETRSGIGKLRGRRNKQNAGLLFVIGSKEKAKANIVDVKNAKELNVIDLAEGQIGRLVIYTKDAISELGERIK